MSIETWKAEFYSPVEETTKKDAIDHSLRKWEGLKANNLKRHGLGRTLDGDLYDLATRLRVFGVDGYTCALCHHYYTLEDRCRNCPIAKFLKKDRVESCDGQYSAYTQKGRITPMITLLKKVRAAQNSL